MEKYALISVSDKTNILQIANFLKDKNYNILSTGGTYLHLTENNIPSKQVSNFTGFPEILNGRVKTLHPLVFGSILQPEYPSKASSSSKGGPVEEKNDIDLCLNSLVDLDVVVVNLYPFENNNCIENIDIGGVSLIRAAAKNHERVSVLTDPKQYLPFMEGKITNEDLAFQAFRCTSKYDTHIRNWFDKDSRELKYGCNPHQKPSKLVDNNIFTILNGNPGYINFLDAWGCWNLVNDIKYSNNKICACTFKHTSPAGVAYAGDKLSYDPKMYYINEELFNVVNESPVARAYLNARHCDPKSSFGDFIGINAVVDVPLALYLKMCVADGIVALGYDEDALQILKQKKNGNFIILEGKIFNPKNFEYIESRDFGKMTLQQKNNNSVVIHSNKDVVLGLTTLKYTQSNSTCFVYNGCVIGIGAGQQNRVDCVKIARQKSKVWLLRKMLNKKFNEELKNKKTTEKVNFMYDFFEQDEYIVAKSNDMVKTLLLLKKQKIEESENSNTLVDSIENNELILCSDGFFPFEDSVKVAQTIGVSGIYYPGGSLCDDRIKNYCVSNKIKLNTNFERLFYH